MERYGMDGLVTGLALYRYEDPPFAIFPVAYS